MSEDPTEFRPSRASNGSGTVLTGRGRRDKRGPQLPGSVAPGTTDEGADLVTLEPSEDGPDPAVRARAREIAARLSLRRPRRDRRQHRGVGDLASLPYRDGSADLDLDRTIEALLGNPDEVDDESGVDRRIIVRERVRTRRSVVLVVDVSGSMKGERIRTAAATVGAVAGELADDDLAVIAFWSDAAVLHPLGAPARPTRLLDLLLSVPARGLTNVGFPLQLAARELSRVPARDARVLLLSDCVHNAGPDPRPLAARLPRLDVLLDIGTPPGEHDLDLGRDLAEAGRGRLRPIRSHRDVAPALTSIFTS
ncbi:vWA domain-containing protein [Cryptosporangium aurantiacum]|uniref:Mg-chelatase subunit ChlD n=1 Tax=Cryptosporangium aurantiacum TaxID=134849 RepID=A0A1M7RPI4_9ACTN|nr:VWA domain-containing protein [Cryptosporangium aurantiacum]SHN48139.1 Mg-chelatase subunit ChlD [Cryptosporangium aurantiacum]